MGTSFILSVKCPHCGKSFMDDTNQVNGHPGIRLNIETDSERGVLWLCPIYNCFAHKSSIVLKDDEMLKFFCPHCNKSLLQGMLCESCHAPLVAMNINIGGKVDICSRNGCKNHFVVFEDLNDALSLFYDKFDNITK